MATKFQQSRPTADTLAQITPSECAPICVITIDLLFYVFQKFTNFPAQLASKLT